MSLTGVVGLMLDGIDIQRPDLDVFLAIDEGLDELPSMRGGSDLIPFRHGRLPTPRFADFRRIVLNGWVSGPATASMPVAYRAYLDELHDVLDPKSKEAIHLIATMEDESVRSIHVRVSNIIPGQVLASGARLMSVELEALDPFWYGSYGVGSLDSGLLLNDGEYLDQGATIIVTPTSTAYDITLTIPGTTDSERVRIALKGPSVGPVGVEVVSQMPIGFIHPVISSQVILYIDNLARTARLADQERLRWDPGVSARAALTFREGNLHGEYIRIPTGDQTIRILGQPLEARLLFTPTFS